MKSVTFGCLGAILGLVAGVILAFAAGQLMGSSAQPIDRPTSPPASQSAVSITASAAFLNSQLQQAARTSGLGRQASITLASPNLVQVAGTVDVSVLGVPLTVGATISMRVIAQRGRILLTVDRIDAGGITVPQSTIGPEVEKMRAAVENEINVLVQRALQGTSLRVSNIRVTPSDMSVDLVSQ